MMNQEDIFKKIGQILNELQDQYDFLAQNPQQLNELELELFLANANFLSDHVEIVRKINNSRPLKQLPEHIETPVAEQQDFSTQNPELEQIEKEELQQEDVEAIDNTRPSFEFIMREEPLSDKFEFEEKSVIEIFDRPLSEEEQRIITEKQKLQEVKTEPVILQETVETVVEVEQPAFPLDKVEEKEVHQVSIEVPVRPEPQPSANSPKPTLNDMLAARNSGLSSFNEESNKPAITDLKGGINLNEKLLYIKDLFNGYNLAYSEAIDLINKMPDLKTADVFLKNNYAEKNNWQAKQTTVDKFYALLAQRFPEG